MQTQVSVKGKLKSHVDYWENVIDANMFVTSLINEGYRIHFTYNPQKANFKNNISALRNNNFLTDSIKDLLANKLLKETNNIPHIINLLSVAENSAGKKRLILELRYVNKHIYTHKVKFDKFSSGKLMVKLGILFLHLCHLDLIQSHFCLRRFSTFQ